MEYEYKDQPVVEEEAVGKVIDDPDKAGKEAQDELSNNQGKE